MTAFSEAWSKQKKKMKALDRQNDAALNAEFRSLAEKVWPATHVWVKDQADVSTMDAKAIKARTKTTADVLSDFAGRKPAANVEMLLSSEYIFKPFSTSELVPHHSLTIPEAVDDRGPVLDYTGSSAMVDTTAAPVDGDTDTDAE